MPKCHFCNAEIKPGKGLLYVTNDAKQYWFCSSKCRKSFFMKRNPRKLKWVRKKQKSAK